MDNKIRRSKNIRRDVRIFRIRKKIKGTNDRPRLIFIKSLKYLYVQLVNDLDNKVISGFTTLNNKNIVLKNFKNINAASVFGKFVGEKLKGLGISKLVFDRNGYKYHGKVKVFADALRSEGINF